MTELFGEALRVCEQTSPDLRPGQTSKVVFFGLPELSSNGDRLDHRLLSKVLHTYPSQFPAFLACKLRRLKSSMLLGSLQIRITRDKMMISTHVVGRGHRKLPRLKDALQKADVAWNRSVRADVGKGREAVMLCLSLLAENCISFRPMRLKAHSWLDSFGWVDRCCVGQSSDLKRVVHEAAGMILSLESELASTKKVIKHNQPIAVLMTGRDVLATRLGGERQEPWLDFSKMVEKGAGNRPKFMLTSTSTLPDKKTKATAVLSASVATFDAEPVHQNVQLEALQQLLQNVTLTETPGHAVLMSSQMRLNDGTRSCAFLWLFSKLEIVVSNDFIWLLNMTGC
ncbi:hypothetical protein BJ742DRAFT_741187 [Cladochytrium replicatum]|nr:hypothetical protein BJ742DRAFT_741187 [Cladochytrium replicatum]